MALNPQNIGPGEEQHESYYPASLRGKQKRVQYDYRHWDGELFSCVGKTLADCHAKCDEWIQRKQSTDIAGMKSHLSYLMKVAKAESNTHLRAKGLVPRVDVQIEKTKKAIETLKSQRGRT